jgi:hypothetical protein
MTGHWSLDAGDRHLNCRKAIGALRWSLDWLDGGGAVSFFALGAADAVALL